MTFDIDANGILHVSAKDKATGKEQKIRIEASSGLSDTDIHKMVKDAEKNADEDKKRREEIDTRNRLDSMTYEVEKNAKEWSDKLPAELKTQARGGGRAGPQGAPRRRHGRDPGRAGGAEPQRTARPVSRSTRRVSRSAANDGGPMRRQRPAPTAKPKGRTTWSKRTTRSWTTKRSKVSDRAPALPADETCRRARGCSHRRANSLQRSAICNGVSIFYSIDGRRLLPSSRSLVRFVVASAASISRLSVDAQQAGRSRETASKQRRRAAGDRIARTRSWRSPST